MTTGVIAELKHQLNGLDSGLIIKSQTTGKEWRVKKRILFHHTIDRQKKFTNEATAFTHSSFGSLENMFASSKNILDKEEQNIFKYQLQSLGQHSKPVAGDTLVPVTTEKFPCPCCGYKTFDNKPDGSYDICPVCFWEDDPIQLDDPDYEGGANPMSLRQAQQNFLEFGACDRDMLQNVRQPTKDEERDKDWQSLDRK
ncbi:MAG TPA: CPCC family cysteine-rich protein [Chitinophagaceae bacterium]|nr:CPCC family cysteine-rich protein [Chitinophagaceae bacterium]